MKTLTILFEFPNIFYAIIDGVNIRIENPEVLKGIVYSIMGDFFKVRRGCDSDELLKPGDIFQVE
jgi:hypothetical protein